MCVCVGARACARRRHRHGEKESIDCSAPPRPPQTNSWLRCEKKAALLPRKKKQAAAQHRKAFLPPPPPPPLPFSSVGCSRKKEERGGRGEGSDQGVTDMHASAAKLWSETEEEKLGKVSRKRERESQMRRRKGEFVSLGIELHHSSPKESRARVI